MKPTIILLLLAVLGWTACSDDDGMDVSGNNPNTGSGWFRAVAVSGSNAHWGDYDWTFAYENDRLAEGVRTNAAGDTVGVLEVARQSAIQYLYTLADRVARIDADSIARLEQRLEATYGPGNYSLKDSIPMLNAIYYRMLVDLYEDGRVVQQTITLNLPKANPGSGKDYDAAYYQARRTHLLYEYDGQGRILVCREIDDVFDPENEEVFARALRKDEFVYNERGALVEVVHYEAPDGGSFEETGRGTYVYQGDRLTAITGSAYACELVWAGDTPASWTSQGATTHYQWNADGCLTGISGPADTQTVTYEPGTGNLRWLAPLRDALLGKPGIQ